MPPPDLVDVRAAADARRESVMLCATLFASADLKVTVPLGAVMLTLPDQSAVAPENALVEQVNCVGSGVHEIEPGRAEINGAAIRDRALRPATAFGKMRMPAAVNFEPPRTLNQVL